MSVGDFDSFGDLGRSSSSVVFDPINGCCFSIVGVVFGSNDGFLPLKNIQVKKVDFFFGEKFRNSNSPSLISSNGFCFVNTFSNVLIVGFDCGSEN